VYKFRKFIRLVKLILLGSIWRKYKFDIFEHSYIGWEYKKYKEVCIIGIWIGYLSMEILMM
jgi:hypothetical protein